jgi:hypothetical protein
MMSARLVTKAKILETRFVMSIDRFFIELPPFSVIFSGKSQFFLHHFILAQTEWMRIKTFNPLSPGGRGRG